MNVAQGHVKPIITSIVSINRTFGINDKKETLNAHFEKLVLTIAGLTVAFLFIIFLMIGIFYTV